MATSLSPNKQLPTYNANPNIPIFVPLYQGFARRPETIPFDNIFNRPGVAGAVLQSPPSLIDSLTE